MNNNDNNNETTDKDGDDDNNNRNNTMINNNTKKLILAKGLQSKENENISCNHAQSNSQRATWQFIRGSFSYCMQTLEQLRNRLVRRKDTVLFEVV